MPKRRDAKPPRTGPGERDTLTGFLDHLRDAVVAKAEGAPEPEVRTPGVPSGTNVLGLVKHLACVEGFYFLGEDVTDWAATMHAHDDETVEEIVGRYRDTVRRSNDVIAGYDDLSLDAPRPGGRKAPSSMRWLLVHMIEETGRHAGHADILRERIDGATGR